jgi:hypothetical protein
MANINLVTNTYGGKKFAEYLTPALLAPKGIVNRKIVTPITTTKNKHTVLTADRALEFQTPSAVFTPQTGNIDRGEKTLTLLPYEVMDQLNFELLRQTWESEDQKAGSLNDYLATPEIYNFLINRIYVPKMSIISEQLYLLGKGGVTTGSATFIGTYPGLLATIEGDATVNKLQLNDTCRIAVTGVSIAAGAVVTGSATDIAKINVGDVITFFVTGGAALIGGAAINGQSSRVTSKPSTTTITVAATTTGTAATGGFVYFINQSNAISALTQAYTSVEDRIRRMPGTKVLIGSDIEKALRVANATQANGSGAYFREKYFDGIEILQFLDMEVEVMPYWKPNTIAVWNPGNVFLAIDLESDEVSAKVTWMGDVTNDQVYRLRARMKSAIDYVYGSEIVYVRPA